MCVCACVRACIYIYIYIYGCVGVMSGHQSQRNSYLQHLLRSIRLSRKLSFVYFSINPWDWKEGTASTKDDLQSSQRHKAVKPRMCGLLVQSKSLIVGERDSGEKGHKQSEGSMGSVKVITKQRPGSEWRDDSAFLEVTQSTRKMAGLTFLFCCSESMFCFSFYALFCWFCFF